MFRGVFQTKNAPAQSYLSGGTFIPKETQKRELIF